MADIFKQYSGAILTSISFGLLLIIFFFSWGGRTDSSVLDEVGSRTAVMLEQRNINYTNHKDKLQFNTHAARRLPTAKARGHVKEKTAMNLVDTLLITDHDGYIWNDASHRAFVSGSRKQAGVVTVLSITDSNGTEYIDNASVYNKSTHMITFPKIDAYYIRLNIMDYDNVEATYTVPLPVDLRVD